MQRNDRDCLVCCLAEVFGIPYESIPKFYEVFPVKLNDMTDAHADIFSKQYNAWLETMGYTHVYIEAKYNKGKDLIEYYGMPRKDFVGIASMKKNNRPYSHAVVVRNQNGVVEFFDPKPNSDYTMENLTEIEIFVPSIFNGELDHFNTNACIDSSCRYYGENCGCTLEVCLKDYTDKNQLMELNR